MIVHYDCRHFVGHKPCTFRRECAGCPHYSPLGRRILILKLAAMGDVLRTTPLLTGLRTANTNCHITWVTEANVVPLLRGVAEIDRLLPYGWETALQIEQEAFDELYCFDKEARAAALAMKIRAARKVGFGMNEFGSPMPPSGPLKAGDIEIIKAWIDQGAAWPDELANDGRAADGPTARIRSRLLTGCSVPAEYQARRRLMVRENASARISTLF